MPSALGQLVLAVHLVVIAFNLFGLAAVPLGAALGWSWVRILWWRLLHLAALAVVALQAVSGRACFLTDWQDALTGGGAREPLIMRSVNSLIYWPLPMWVFTAAYVAVFAYAAGLWWFVRPTRRARPLLPRVSSPGLPASCGPPTRTSRRWGRPAGRSSSATT